MVVWALISAPAALGLAYVPYFVKACVLKWHKAYNWKEPRKDKSINPKIDALIVRCNGAHYNQLESLGSYSAAIVAGVAVGVSPAKLSQIATGYVGSRIAYNVAYLSPPCLKATPRSLAWVGTMGSLIWAWVAVIAKARKNEKEDE